MEKNIYPEVGTKEWFENRLKELKLYWKHLRCPYCEQTFKWEVMDNYIKDFKKINEIVIEQKEEIAKMEMQIAGHGDLFDEQKQTIEEQRKEIERLKGKLDKIDGIVYSDERKSSADRLDDIGRVLKENSSPEPVKEIGQTIHLVGPDDYPHIGKRDQCLKCQEEE